MNSTTIDLNQRDDGLDAARDAQRDSKAGFPVHIAEDEKGSAPPADTAIDHRALTVDRGIWRTRLAQTIEGEIIPRLMLVHGAQAARQEADAGSAVVPESDVDVFASIIVRGELRAAETFVHGLRAAGVPLETILLELMAPAARRLGDYWTDDILDFAEVTLGLSRLQQLLHEFAPAFAHETEHREHQLPILLAQVPGEQHSFGILMVEEFFRRAGWDVWASVVSSRDDLVSLVRSHHFVVCGLSLSSGLLIDEMAMLIREIRRASRNPDIRIMAGGSVFVDEPLFSARVGADATALDGRDAVEQARKLVSLMPARC